MDRENHLEGFVLSILMNGEELMVDLRISIREKGVFACFHPDAGDLFNVCSDLKRVCWTLYDPKKRLEKNASLFVAFIVSD
jgi:DNA ligase-4